MEDILMKYEDLSFTVTNDNGEEITCDIVSVVPNPDNDDNPYVVFTDYMLDENDEFVLQYGKLLKEGEDYTLVGVTDPKEVDFIKVFDLAQKHNLTFYDASYLQLAVDLKIPLATYDQQLIDAAKAEKVKLIG